MRLTLEKTKRIEVPNDEDGGYINIKFLHQEELANIESRSSETMFDTSGGVKVIVNSYKRTNSVAKKCLVGWGNFFDEKGNELRFPRDIDKASNYSINVNGKLVRFLEWVESCHTEFRDEVIEEIKVAEKN